MVRLHSVSTSLTPAAALGGPLKESDNQAFRADELQHVPAADTAEGRPRLVPPSAEHLTFADYDIYSPRMRADPHSFFGSLREQRCPIARSSRWGGSWIL